MLLLNAISHVERGQDPNRTIVVLKKKKFLAIYSQVRNSGRRRGFSNNWVQMGNSMSLKQTCLKMIFLDKQAPSMHRRHAMSIISKLPDIVLLSLCNNSNCITM